MIGKIKNAVRAIAKRPLVGGPFRIILNVKKVPQIYSMVLEVNHRVHETKNRIDDIDQQIIVINHRLHEVIDHAKDVDEQINSINDRVDEMKTHINRIGRRVVDIGLLIDSMGKNISEIRQQQVRESEHLPKLLESLDYYENLKKSLPAAFRHQVRK